MNFIINRRPVSFRTRLIVLMVFFSLVPSVINMVISYHYSSDSLKKQYVSGAQVLLSVASQNLNAYFNDITSYMDFPYADPQFLNYVRDETGKESYEHNKYANSTLMSVLFSRHDLEAISMYVWKWDKLFVLYPKLSINQTIQTPSSQWTGNLVEIPRERFNHIYWDYISPIHQLYNTSENNLFTITRSFYYNFKLLGMFYFDFNVSYLTKLADSLRTNSDEFIMILDRSGNSLYTSGAVWDLSVRKELATSIVSSNNANKTMDYVIDKERNLILYEKLTNFPWLVVKGIPYKSLERNVYSVTLLNVIIQISFTIAGVLLAILLSIWLYRPLLHLVRGINRVNQGQLEHEIPPSGGSEMIKIINSFNDMTKNLHKWIEIDYKNRLNLQLAQLKALQAQINPHFLFNALQVIGSMAVEKDVEEINEVTSSLAKMCRYSIKPGKDIVLLKEEIEHVHHYLKIQQLRFGSNLHYEIHISEHLWNVPIPKLSLLPLIENAFVHGLKHRIDATLFIMVTEKEHVVMVEVADNGAGIDEERLKQISRWLDESTERIFHSERIGLANVQERLMRYFGPLSRLELHSDPTLGGTVVKFKLPYTGGD